MHRHWRCDVMCNGPIVDVATASVRAMGLWYMIQSPTWSVVCQEIWLHFNFPSMSAATRGCIASYLRQFSICAFPTHHRHAIELNISKNTMEGVKKKAEECRNTSIQDFGQFRRIVAGLLARAVHSDRGGGSRGGQLHPRENYIYDFYNVIMNYSLDIWNFFRHIGLTSNPCWWNNPAYGPAIGGSQNVPACSLPVRILLPCRKYIISICELELPA